MTKLIAALAAAALATTVRAADIAPPPSAPPATQVTPKSQQAATAQKASKPTAASTNTAKPVSCPPCKTGSKQPPGCAKEQWMELAPCPLPPKTVVKFRPSREAPQKN